MWTISRFDRHSFRRVIPLFTAFVLMAPVLLAAPGGLSSSSDRSEDGKPLVSVSVFPNRGTISGGDTFNLYVHARMKPEWHIYWVNPGETGMATDISIDAPEGYQVGSIQWPRPIPFETGGITSYGYSEETVLTVPVTAPDQIEDETPTFNVHITSLACREKCIMQNHEKTVTVASDAVPNREMQAKIRTFQNAVPEPFSSLKQSNVRWEKNAVVFTGDHQGADTIRFYPISVSGVRLGTPTVSFDDSTFTLRVPVEWHPENHLGKENPAVKGVIGVGPGKFDESYRVSEPLSDEFISE